MATTPNYGWVTPAPTDFVTDLPADFEVFADAVDADLAGLLGGTTGQVLAKDSGTDHDFSWVTPAASPITTEGDLIIGDATGDAVRLPIGAANTVLISDGDTADWGTGGGMTLIATATPSAATTVSFTSIPVFKTLLLVVDSAFQSSGAQHWGVRFNNDSGTEYYWAGLVTAGGTPTDRNQSGTLFGTSNVETIIPSCSEAATPINNTANGQMWIFNADQTTGRKKVWWQSYSAHSSSGATSIQGIYTGTSVISQIDLIRNSTQTLTGTIRLYGIS